MTVNHQLTESSEISVCDEGFWSPDPYVEILNHFSYENPKTQARQYTMIDEAGEVRMIRIYHRYFSLEEISKMLQENGFRVEGVFNSLSGEAFEEGSKIYGIIARKK